MQQSERQQAVRCVVICSPHKLVVGGITDILTDAGYRVVAEPTSAASCIEALPDVQADVILLDACLVGEDSSNVHELASRGHNVAILLGMERSGALILGAILAGARGCLSDDDPPSQFADSVGLVARKSMVISNTASRAMRHEMVTAFERRTGSPLNERERRIAVLVSEGRTNREIGDVIHLSEHTVKADIKRILAKLGLSNRQQLAVHLVKSGLLDGFSINGLIHDGTSAIGRQRTTER